MNQPNKQEGDIFDGKSSPTGNNQNQKFNQEELNLLQKDQWLDIKEKAERLVIANEQKHMQEIKKTVDLLDFMIEKGLEAFQKQQIQFFIDEILFTVVKNVIEHKEYQQEDNYLIAEKIILKTLDLIIQSVDLDIPKMAEILSYIFNPSRSLYSKTIIVKSLQQTDYPVSFLNNMLLCIFNIPKLSIPEQKFQDDQKRQEMKMFCFNKIQIQKYDN